MLVERQPVGLVAEGGEPRREPVSGAENVLELLVVGVAGEEEPVVAHPGRARRSRHGQRDPLVERPRDHGECRSTGRSEGCAQGELLMPSGDAALTTVSVKSLPKSVNGDPKYFGALTRSSELCTDHVKGFVQAGYPKRFMGRWREIFIPGGDWPRSATREDGGREDVIGGAAH
ncbi:hypothetical protein ABZ912_45465 [Nonomuraea angiospora]